MDNFKDTLVPLLSSFVTSGVWFFLCGAIYIILAHLFSQQNEQPHFRKDMAADSLYWFVGPIVYSKVFMVVAGLLLFNIYSQESLGRFNMEGLSPLKDLPIWLQALLILLITDFIQYFIHRGFHGSKLWRYHSIHHSSKHVDWLSSARFHPVNVVFYSTTINAAVYTLGFSPEAFLVLQPFNVLFSCFVHANLNWSLGPFKYLIASPVFHRWHHTSPDQGGDKNFAPTFPFIDKLFGTFYMPKGEIPKDFGTPHDDIPDSFFGQIAYPFKRKR